MANKNKAFEFGPFRLEVRERRLTRDGYSVPLRGRVFDTLYALVSRHGCLVTKDELMAIVWPHTVVEESNLNHNICILRRALGEKATGQKYVETVPRQGYRFVADVRELDDVEASDFPHIRHTQEVLPHGGESRADLTLSPDDPQLPPLDSGPPSTPGFQRHTPWYLHQSAISSLAVTLLLVIGYFGIEHFEFFLAPSNARIKVAVLPFENLTGDPSQRYVADGLTHEIIAQLGRLNTARLGVIANTSSELYQDAQKSISEIARELDVSYVVEGSLRRNKNSYRITVMLIRVEDQAHLWAANYSREASNVTALQVEIAKIVIDEIGRRIRVEPDEGSPTAELQILENLPSLLHSLRGGECATGDQAISHRRLGGGPIGSSETLVHGCT